MGRNSAWSKLKASEKEQIIRFAIDNGVSDIKDIRDTYDLYSTIDTSKVETHTYKKGGKTKKKSRIKDIAYRIMSQAPKESRDLGQIAQAIVDSYRNASYDYPNYTGSIYFGDDEWESDAPTERDANYMFLYGNEKGQYQPIPREEYRGHSYAPFVKQHYPNQHIGNYYGMFYPTNQVVLPKEIEPLFRYLSSQDMGMYNAPFEVTKDERINALNNGAIVDDTASFRTGVGYSPDGTPEFQFSDLIDFGGGDYKRRWGNKAGLQGWLLNQVGTPFMLRQYVPVQFTDDENAVNESAVRSLMQIAQNHNVATYDGNDDTLHVIGGMPELVVTPNGNYSEDYRNGGRLVHKHGDETAKSYLDINTSVLGNTVPVQQNDNTSVYVQEPIQTTQMPQDVYLDMLQQQSKINQGVIRDADYQKTQEIMAQNGILWNDGREESEEAKQIQQTLANQTVLEQQQNALKAAEALVGLTQPSAYYNLFNLDNPLSETQATALDLAFPLITGGLGYGAKVGTMGLQVGMNDLRRYGTEVLKRTNKSFTDKILFSQLNSSYGKNISHLEKFTLPWLPYVQHLSDINLTPTLFDGSAFPDALKGVHFATIPTNVQKIYEKTVIPRMIKARPWLRDTEQFKRNIMFHLDEGYNLYPSATFDAALRGDAAGMFFPTTKQIAIKDDYVDFALPHEIRHKIDNAIPLTQRETQYLTDAFGNEFLSIGDKYGLLTNNMFDEMVTTNLDARNALLGEFMKKQSVELQNIAIDMYSDEKIIKAISKSNGYGQALIKELKEANLLTPERIQAFRDAMKYVGAVAAPISIIETGNTQNSKSTGGPLYPFSFYKNPYWKTPVVRYSNGGELNHKYGLGDFLSKMFARSYDGDFNTAFANARSDGREYFKWNGNRYTTQLKAEVYEENHPEEYTSDFAYSDAMNRIVREENQKLAKNGYIAELDAWQPHTSVEGGAKTIGYGLKLDSHNQAVLDELAKNKNEKYKEGYISNDFALQQSAKLLKDEYEPLAKNYWNKTFNDDSWDRLSPKMKSIILDYQYNVKGGIGAFPKLMKAIHDQDFKGIKANYKRYSGNKELGRNKGIAKELEQFYDGTYSIYNL